MFASKIAIVSLLAGAAMAAPGVVEKRHCTITKEVASFDDKNFIPAAPLTNAVGVYKGLDIEGFFGANTQVLGVNIQPITPPSPPNVIVAGLPNHVLQGGQSFSVQYNASPYYAFNLHSLRFACFLDTVLSPVNVAETCTVIFTGFSPHGKQMATKSFTFTNNGLAVGQPFATANFPVVSWCNLGKVTIDVTTDNPVVNAADLNAVAIDDIHYTLQSQSCAP